MPGPVELLGRNGPGGERTWPVVGQLVDTGQAPLDPGQLLVIPGGPAGRRHLLPRARSLGDLAAALGALAEPVEDPKARSIVLARGPQREGLVDGVLGVTVGVDLTGGLPGRDQQRPSRGRLVGLDPVRGDDAGRSIPSLEYSRQRCVMPSATGPGSGCIQRFAHQVVAEGGLAGPAGTVGQLDEEAQLEQLLDASSFSATSLSTSSRTGDPAAAASSATACAGGDNAATRVKTASRIDSGTTFAGAIPASSSPDSAIAAANSSR